MREAKKCKQCGRTIYFDGICVRCQTENKRNMILAMSEQEINEKIDMICCSAEELDDKKELCKMLIRYRDINTERIAEAAWKHSSLMLPEVYKNASEQVINEMIEMLMCDDTEPMTANHILICLAHAGGKKVLKAFRELEENPREWRKKLYVDPSKYAVYGGWTFDRDGNLIKTNFDICYPIVKGTAEDKEKSPVKLAASAEEACPDCGCKTVNLIELDGRDKRLSFLGIDGVVKIRCCPNCVPFASEYFCRYEIDGGCEIMPGKCYSLECEDSEWVDDMANNTYVLGEEPVPVRYAADWEGGSSLGGFAFWIDDCIIKECPDCGKPMIYLAQIQWDNILDGAEGNAYIEICRDCNTAAILSQQT